MKPYITRMGLEDLSQVIEIEQTGPEPWNRRQFAEELSLSFGFQYVARFQPVESVVAYLCGRLLHAEAEILKLAVAVSYRRQGLGNFLLAYTLKILKEQGVSSCFLELRDTNIAARKLYVGHGFKESGRRKGYYTEPVEDAVLMAKSF